jgi:AAA15 family ATPase/GTPase
MEGKKLIHSMRLQNFLSYGDKGEEVKLEPLNVLIGRNASGKSNLIEAVGVIHSLPTSIASGIRQAEEVLMRLSGKEVKSFRLLKLKHLYNTQFLQLF